MDYYTGLKQDQKSKRMRKFFMYSYEMITTDMSKKIKQKANKKVEVENYGEHFATI